MAEELNLLSLPDDLLEEIFITAFRHPVNLLRDWAKAALTCKRLYELQLPVDPPTIRKWEALKWLLKHHQGAKSVRIQVVDWPGDDVQLRKLSDSLLKVSSNLMHMEQLEIWPWRNVGKTPWRSLHPLSPWIAAMLLGASSMTDVSLGMEMLQWLPMPRMKALESLCLDAEDDVAVLSALQAVRNCQQLRTLTIVCHTKDKHWNVRGDSELLEEVLRNPKLDLRHLVAAWSKVWCQIQAHVQSLTVEGYPDSRPFGLHEWPQGIDALHGLQFLQLNCRSIISLDCDETCLDLAHLAYIPHVSLYSESCMYVKISRGTWRVLELECAGACHIDIDDAGGFMKGTNTFCFIFNSAQRRLWHSMGRLIQKLKGAGADTGHVLYEYHNVETPLRKTHLGKKHRKELALKFGNAPMMELRNCQREGNASESVFLRARHRCLNDS